MKALILGAGIGGLSASVALGKVGIETEVWEQAPELRAMGSGISIMSNAIRGYRALDIDLGLGQERGAYVESAEILTPQGRVLASAPITAILARVGAPSVAIHRGDLQAALAAAVTDCTIHLGARATGFAANEDGVRVEFADGRQASGDVLIGADGISSVVRRQLHGATSPRYGGFLCWLACAHPESAEIPPGWSAQFWGAGARFGIHDIGKGRVYWWGTKSMPEADARSWSGDRKTALREIFRGWAPVTRQLIDETPEDGIIVVPSQDLPFLEHWGQGPVTLLGDAAHAMLTSFAQGGSSAVEDAIVLAKCLAAAEDDPQQGLRTYEELRRGRTRWLVEGARKLAGVEQQTDPLSLLARDLYLRFLPSQILFRDMEKAMTAPDFASIGSAGRPKERISK